MKCNPTDLLKAVLLTGGCLASAQVTAADCENPRKPGTLSESVYSSVNEAAKLMAEKKYDDAIKRLKDVADSGKGSDYERALVNLNLGFAHSSKDDYAGAAAAFAKAVALESLPQQQHEQLQYNLGQLYLAAKKYDAGIAALERYIAQACDPVPPEAHLFLANALSEVGRPAEALPQIDMALSKAKEPKESWLQLKLAIQYQIKDYAAGTRTLVQLIGMAPDKVDYWKQLSSLFYEMDRDIESLAVLALARSAELLQKPEEIDNLYNIYMGLELPYKAGQLISAAMQAGLVEQDEKHIEMAANAWINASESERAETDLKRLAEMSERGEYYFRLGALYGESERWKDSIEMLTKAIEKGGLKRPGDAWMRLALARYSLKDHGGAREALQRAVNYDNTRKQASEWLRHLGATQSEAGTPLLTPAREPEQVSGPAP
jgi:predicted Zn-dependent protease